MEKAKLQHSGELYDPMDAELQKKQLRRLDMVYQYNRIRPSNLRKREKTLRNMFAEMGENVYIEPPLRANFGGQFVHIGNNVYANYNLTLVDDTHIWIGDNTLIGPNVILCTAGHPVLPELREKGMQFNAPVRIGKNCWLGGGAIVLPGVTIGDHTVIGAGSVVTKDIPSGVVAVGNPCRVMREIGEEDEHTYFRDHEIPDQLRPRPGFRTNPDGSV